MESKSRIIRDKEQEQVYLSLLNGHFKTVSLEKYNDAMMGIILRDACNNILGDGFCKKRISKRKEKKIKLIVEERMRNKYGRWVNVTNFKIKDVNSIYFKTNLDRVFTVFDLGKLYGANYHCCCGNIFFTEHCLGRFEDRVNQIIYQSMMCKISRQAGGPATSVDVLSALISSGELEYGSRDGHYHVGITIGTLVLEDFGDVFIAKTFLSPDMIKPVKWFKPDMFGRNEMMSFADVIKCQGEYVDSPNFVETQSSQYKESHKVISNEYLMNIY